MTDIILLGGFLGSGKTTLMVGMAKILEQRGIRTSVITNDQGDTLVDTVYSEMEGLQAREVAGGCFCCRFPDFLQAVEEIRREHNPDCIIAEAVGSCTDLAATVINPLKTFHNETLKVLAFLTLVDGIRMNGEYRALNLKEPAEPGEVLISHQIWESEVLVLSKTDLLSDEQADYASRELQALNPRAEILRCSARNGEGLEALVDKALRGFPLDFTERVPIDYGVYAEAEAAYGWYNGSWLLEGDREISPMDLSFELMESFSRPELGDVAHAKLFILTPSGALKVSFVMGRIQADDITVEDRSFDQVKIFLNVRAACAPAVIEEHVLHLQVQLKSQGYAIREYEGNSLIPSPPEPYYSPEGQKT